MDACPGLPSAQARRLRIHFTRIVGAFGLVLISGFLNDYAQMLRVIGGLLLLFIGTKTFISKTDPQSQDEVKPLGPQLLKDFVTTFFLTLTNPATLFSFMVIFAMLGITGKSHFMQSEIVVAGVFAGSLLWWLFLSTSVSLMKSKITDSIMQRTNAVMGIFIFGFGVLALLSVVFH